VLVNLILVCDTNEMEKFENFTEPYPCPSPAAKGIYVIAFSWTGVREVFLKKRAYALFSSNFSYS